ncbi:pilus assembly PilX family protein [Janthinobacterium fluminis]|uniref:Tfp pilus assembly protein PilX n=1 Tax=Janthinobacterium fluminis TaxID=2987524 RepID=A0ABT5K4R7_9BURK|nr:hypothetical protein [Janthinobacterium fluminis]MDC8759983.1 hypothetical protein [Janthinobacterium fluminis]
MNPVHPRQRGIALPVMLIMLAVLLVSSIYLLKASMSTTLMSANLAYDASLSKAADLGLLTGFQWLKDTAAANKGQLDNSFADAAYVATLDTTQSVANPGFWVGSKVIDDRANSGNRIEYVIHRMCALSGAYDKAANTCMQTAPNTAIVNNTVALGDSLASDSTSLAGAPQVHYIVTARIFGVRGGNVVNQLVVMIGA